MDELADMMSFFPFVGLNLRRSLRCENTLSTHICVLLVFPHLDFPDMPLTLSKRIKRMYIHDPMVPITALTACTQAPEEKQFAAVLEKLSRVPLEAMRNRSVVSADLVREVGLVRDHRPLYGRESIYQHKRRGFGMFQLPEQVGCLLSELNSISKPPLRTMVEVGAWYGWTGLFFSVYARRLLESATMGGTSDGAGMSRPSFCSASTDIRDLRTPCVKQLMARYEHRFHAIPKPWYLSNGTRMPRLTLAQANAGASAWYEQRLSESFASCQPRLQQRKIDLCFIDGEHKFASLAEDVKFFRSRCRFLLFHDIADTDSRDVVRIWNRLSRRLLWERDQRAKQAARKSPSTTSRASTASQGAERGYFVRECTQQAGTNRSNFGLGLISTRHLNVSWIHQPVYHLARYQVPRGHANYERWLAGTLGT